MENGKMDKLLGKEHLSSLKKAWCMKASGKKISMMEKEL
jgi:hypothetical protein